MSGTRIIPLLIALIASLTCSGCVSEVKNLVTGIIKGTGAVIQGARDYIPSEAPPYITEYIAPWEDPGLTSTPDYETGHSGENSDTYNTFNPELGIPQGISTADIEGQAVNSQLTPSDDATIQVLKDSYGSFNE